MRKLFFVLYICLFLGQMFSSLQAQQPIRMMSYNLQHCKGLDGKIDYNRLGKILLQENPEVIALQELDSICTRSHNQYQLEQLASETRMTPTYGPAISFQGGKYGIGILSRETPIHVNRIPLPGRNEARLLLVAEFENYKFACTHLSLDADDRLASLPIILQEAAKSSKPFFMAGDWNDTPDSEFMLELKKHFTILSDTQKATYPADKPRECIDYIAVYQPQPVMRPGDVSDSFAAYRPYIGEAALALSRGVMDCPVESDHRPIYAEVIIPLPPECLLVGLPYLQDPQPNEMTVMFQTRRICHTWIEYGKDTLHLTKARTILNGQEVCYDHENRIALSNLLPDTRYFYRVCTSEILKKGGYENHFGLTYSSPFYSFTTPPEKASDFKIIVFNDLHSHKETFQALAKVTKDVHPDFIVFNGDCLPEPSCREHAIRMIHSLADSVEASSTPVIFIRGNHEIRNAYSAGMSSLIGYHDNKTYGAFNWGDTRFVILDCGEDKPDETYVYGGLNDFTLLRQQQLEFLQAELKSKAFRSASRRILLSHIPIFGNTDKYQPCTTLWSPLLSKAPFNISLNGHTHIYAYHPSGTIGVPYPVMVGGGPQLEKATVAILEKKGSTLHLKVLNAKGITLLDKNL